MLEFLLAVIVFGLMFAVAAYGLSRSERAVHKFDDDKRARDRASTDPATRASGSSR